MKKLIFFLLISFAGVLLQTENANAQAFQRLIQGQAGDTLKASETHYTDAVNIGYGNVQALAASVTIDSISGTPAGTATLQQSIDGTHWVTTGSSATWTGVAAWVAVEPATAASDTTFFLSLNPCYGKWARVKVVTTSSTQKAKWYATIYSTNIR